MEHQFEKFKKTSFEAYKILFNNFIFNDDDLYLLKEYIYSIIDDYNSINFVLSCNLIIFVDYFFEHEKENLLGTEDERKYVEKFLERIIFREFFMSYSKQMIFMKAKKFVKRNKKSFMSLI